MTQEIIVFVILAFAAAIVVFNTVKTIISKIKASRAAVSKQASANACGGCTGCSINSSSGGKTASAKSCH